MHCQQGGEGFGRTLGEFHVCILSGGVMHLVRGSDAFHQGEFVRLAHALGQGESAYGHGELPFFGFFEC